MTTAEAESMTNIHVETSMRTTVVHKANLCEQQTAATIYLLSFYSATHRRGVKKTTAKDALSSNQCDSPFKHHASPLFWSLSATEESLYRNRTVLLWQHKKKSLREKLLLSILEIIGFCLFLDDKLVYARDRQLICLLCETSMINDNIQYRNYPKKNSSTTEVHKIPGKSIKMIICIVECFRDKVCIWHQVSSFCYLHKWNKQSWHDTTIKRTKRSIWQVRELYEYAKPQSMVLLLFWFVTMNNCRNPAMWTGKRMPRLDFGAPIYLY